MDGTVHLPISNRTWHALQHTGLVTDPRGYDGTEASTEARDALRNAEPTPKGRGWSYYIDVTPEAARKIQQFCEAVGFAYTASTIADRDMTADGRSLMVTGEIINHRINQYRQRLNASSSKPRGYRRRARVSS